MSKAPQYIRNRRYPPKPLDDNNAHLWKLAKSPWVIVSILATISGAWALYPRLSVSPTDTLRHKDPFGITFTLANDGMTPLRRVEVTCHVRHLYKNGHDLASNVSVSGGLTATILYGAKKLDIPCHSLVETEGIDGADLDIVVSYYPPFVPTFLSNWTDAFHFSTDKSDDGNFVWLPKE